MMKARLKISKDGLTLGNQDFYLASGDIHYFRIHPDDWRQRLTLAKDFGLTAVQTYVPWHLHEKKCGEFDFYGNVGELNLRGFLSLAEDLGLKVMLRPAPYICSECDMGGLPSWLIEKCDVSVRSRDENFLRPVRNYYETLVPEFLPYLSTNGGPVIAVALDNEYGGFGNDTEYLVALREILEDLGVDVPFYTTDGYSSSMLVNGGLPDCLMGVNFRSTPDETGKAIDLLGELRPDFPLFAGEFWCGRSIMWGEYYEPRDPKETAEAYKVALEKGAYVNFYMFAGGTNFGFTSGSFIGEPFVKDPDSHYPKFLPYTTSYDCDALIGEDGNPTEKYFLCRDVLDAYLGKPKRPHTYVPRETQELEIELTEAASLFDNIEALCVREEDSYLPKHFEAMGQSFGYMLYTSQLKGHYSRTWLDLTKSVNDRATVYVDGKYKATYMRDGKNRHTEFMIPPEGVTIQLLVENIARCNNTYDYNEHKGLVKPMLLGNTRNIYNWNQKSFPLDDISALTYQDINVTEPSMPVFLKGYFDAKPGVDSFISTEGFTHGNVWINGFNVGRYWDIGPQKTMYVPGGLLKETGNIIEIFDTEYQGDTKHIKGYKKHLLY